MDTPIRLNTQYGYDQFATMYKVMQEFKRNDEHRKFQEICLADYKKVADQMTFFLEDDDMAKKYKMDDVDVEGWKKFKEMSDLASCLLYFSGFDNKRKQLILENHSED